MKRFNRKAIRKLKRRKYMKKYMRKRRNNIVCHLHEVIWDAIKYQNRSNEKIPYHWKKIVGWSALDLYKHLDSKLKGKMTWKNYGKYWEIDHIIPASKFSYHSFRDKGFKRLWRLSNIQPLPEKQNKMKFTKLPQEWKDYKKEKNIKS